MMRGKTLIPAFAETTLIRGVYLYVNINSLPLWATEKNFGTPKEVYL